MDVVALMYVHVSEHARRARTAKYNAIRNVWIVTAVVVVVLAGDLLEDHYVPDPCGCQST